MILKNNLPRFNFMKRKTLIIIIFFLSIIPNYLSASLTSAPVFIVYHRFGESLFPTTNTTINQLEKQIKTLTSNQYTVLPIENIINKFTSGSQLADKTIGISIDDGYRSIYKEAWPRFQKAKLPFTIFISTASIDRRTNQYLTWDQIREMRNAGVTIGHHTHNHDHMISNFSLSNTNTIQKANLRFKEELGYIPKLFAYPYGEVSIEVKKLVKNSGFLAAFGQHSGVLANQSDLFAIPRFAMNGRFGKNDRFQLVINALPIQTSDFTPLDYIIHKNNPPAIGFTLNNYKFKRINQLHCFMSHGEEGQVKLLGTNRVEIRTMLPFPKGRTRMNCTLPGPNGRWHWLGRMFFVRSD